MAMQPPSSSPIAMHQLQTHWDILKTITSMAAAEGEVIELAPNGGVTKVILREGKGTETPEENHEVTVHCNSPTCPQFRQ